MDNNRSVRLPETTPAGTWTAYSQGQLHLNNEASPNIIKPDRIYLEQFFTSNNYLNGQTMLAALWLCWDLRFSDKKGGPANRIRRTAVWKIKGWTQGQSRDLQIKPNREPDVYEERTTFIFFCWSNHWNPSIINIIRIYVLLHHLTGYVTWWLELFKSLKTKNNILCPCNCMCLLK